MKFCNRLLMVSFLVIMSFVASSRADDKIRVGISAPLTGDAATYGVEMKNAYELAAEHFGKGRYQLIFEDDRCGGLSASSAAQKLVGVEKVRYVLGYACSGALLSAAPVLERNQIFTLSPGASAPKIAEAGDYIFRVWPNEALATPQLIRYIKGRFKRIGILAEETDFAQGSANEVARLCAEQKIAEVVKVDFLSSESEFRTLLLRLSTQNVDAVYLAAQSESSLFRLVKQIREGGYSWPLLGVYLPGSSAFLNLAGKYAEGMVYVDMPPASEIVADQEGRALLAEYQQRFGKPLYDYFVLLTLESFRAFDEGLRSGKDLRSYFYQTQFKGLFGNYWFDRSGDIQGLQFVLRTIRDGKPTTIR